MISPYNTAPLAPRLFIRDQLIHQLIELAEFCVHEPGNSRVATASAEDSK